jgi:hypothetical protein
MNNGLLTVEEITNDWLNDLIQKHEVFGLMEEPVRKIVKWVFVPL